MTVERRTLEPGLDVELYSHEIRVAGARLLAWTLVTNGLAPFGQREVSWTILRHGKRRDGFPEGVIGYVPALRHFAEQGRSVGDGGVSGYRAPGPFGLGAFVGVTFMNAVPIAGVDIPSDGLTGVFLTEGELAMASLSSTRVLNRLGKQARYFPSPYWSDPSRASVYEVTDAEQTILAKLDSAAVREAAATLRGDIMSLVVPTAFAKSLAERLESRTVAAIKPGRGRGVDAALVWSPGQDEPEAIFTEGTDPSVLAATFVALIPNDAPEDDVRFMEDGYVVLLSAGSTARVVSGLRAGLTVRLHGAASGRTLTISTVQ